ncbi:MAG: tyrosine-type recombinase/integrase [Alphaproteobacteria bacterium]|nr:tyrosine-type recombinase/integrase [Alphaproteobacteria bacterium]
MLDSSTGLPMPAGPTPDAVALPPAEAGQNLADRLADFVRAARGAFSANTERAVRSDLDVYGAWCAGRGLQALPAAPETVAAFVDAMAETRAPATVRRYVASIAVAHRAIGHGSTLKSPLVGLALKRTHRRKGRRQGQARPLTWPLCRRLLEAAGDRPIDLRNRALLAVAYDTMLRRAELTALEMPDLLVDVRGDATILVRRSKTDGEGRSEIAYIAPDTVALVRAWLDRAGIVGGRLFRSVDKGGRIGERLDPSQVPRIFKEMARRAGLPAELAEALSGHSTRVGAAQDMVAAGIGLPAILQAGRWKSTAMVNRYGERLLTRKGAAAQLARIQGRGALPCRSQPRLTETTCPP